MPYGWRSNRARCRPGTPLNQIELSAQRFGLSRIPVREALRSLEAEGYLTYRPNKGAAVAAPPSAAGALEILEIRECLELRIMQHVVRQVTTDVIDRASDALRAMNRATDEQAGAGCTRAVPPRALRGCGSPNDGRLHRRLAAALSAR